VFFKKKTDCYFSFIFWQKSPFSNLCAASHRPTPKMEVVNVVFCVCFSVYQFFFRFIQVENKEDRLKKLSKNKRKGPKNGLKND